MDEESPLAQEVTRDLMPVRADASDVLKVKVRCPARSRAAKPLAQMQGDKSKDDPYGPCGE